MDEDIKDCIKKTLNSILPSMVEAYLDNHADLIKKDLSEAKQPEIVVQLIHTLKYWANPMGVHKPSLPPEDYIQFKNLITLIKDPQTLQAERTLSATDLNLVKAAVQTKINQIADQLILHYRLDNLRDQFQPALWSDWWHQKSASEQARIKQNFEQLSAEDKTFLATKASRYKCDDFKQSYCDPVQHPAWYFLMCQYYCYLPQHRVGLYLTPMPVFFNVASPVWSYASYGKSLGSAYPPGTHGGTVSDGVVKGFTLIGAVAAGLGLIAGGIVGAMYAANKALASLKNLFSGNKVLRSFMRLAVISAGVIAGTSLGVPLGIYLAGMIPGIPPGMGAIIGSVATAGLGAGVGAFVAKYAARATSYYFNRNAFNPTNPTKYQLTPEEKNNIARNSLNLRTIEDMMKMIYREKSQLGFKSYFFGTDAYRKRKQLNQLLLEIKKHPQNLFYPLQIGTLCFDARPQYYNPNIPMYSSTADHLSSYFGYPEVQPPSQSQAHPQFYNPYVSPSAPPNIEAIPSPPPVNPELTSDPTLNARFVR